MSVSSHGVHAVLLRRGAVAWAGSTPYAGLADLTDAVARLAAECTPAARRGRVVLTRDVVQLRTLLPAPPLARRALAGYVALDAPRLFRKNGAALVTDGALRRTPDGPRALLAAAAEKRLVEAVLAGCREAGLEVDAVGPAADVLPATVSPGGDPLVFPNGGTSEALELGPDGVWRSRLLPGTRPGPGRPWAPTLATLGDAAPAYAAAFGAAVRIPRLSLAPPEARVARRDARRRGAVRLGLVAAALWLAAGATYGGRLGWTQRTALAELGRFGPAVDSALAVRRDLAAAEATLEELAAARARRSRVLALLAGLTAALDDSMALVALHVAPNGTLRLAATAPGAPRAVAALERVPGLREVRLEGAVARDARGASDAVWDRFSVVARWQP